jgi:hypothetical protein
MSGNTEEVERLILSEGFAKAQEKRVFATLEIFRMRC